MKDLKKMDATEKKDFALKLFDGLPQVCKESLCATCAYMNYAWYDENRDGLGEAHVLGYIEALADTGVIDRKYTRLLKTFVLGGDWEMV